jgi:primosomal protein N''
MESVNYPTLEIKQMLSEQPLTLEQRLSKCEEEIKKINERLNSKPKKKVVRN